MLETTYQQNKSWHKTTSSPSSLCFAHSAGVQWFCLHFLSYKYSNKSGSHRQFRHLSIWRYKVIKIKLSLEDWRSIFHLVFVGGDSCNWFYSLSECVQYMASKLSLTGLFCHIQQHKRLWIKSCKSGCSCCGTTLICFSQRQGSILLTVHPAKLDLIIHFKPETSTKRTQSSYFQGI